MIFSQHIFSPKLSQEILLPLALKHFPWEENEKNLSDLKGRVRSITSSKGRKYMLGLKGPKDPKYQKLDIISKPELEVSISEKEFIELSQMADMGYVVKNRTIAPCQVEDQGITYEFFAEFDNILEVNGYKLKSNFLIVEIEIPEKDSNKLIQVIRSGNINLELPSGLFSFKSLNPIEVPIKSKDDFSDLMASRKLVKLIDSKSGPAPHLRKYFDE